MRANTHHTHAFDGDGASRACRHTLQTGGCKVVRMNLRDLLALEPHGPDTWIGAGPSYPWGGLYGGQIVAQGLMAASHSVPEAFAVHSLHEIGRAHV